MQGKKSKKVILIIELVALLLSWPHLANAQQPKKVPRIGFVTASGPEGPNISLFRQGLQDLGYIEGKNILIEYRYADGIEERLPGLVAELVQLNVDMLVVAPARGIRAAKETTKTIPIIMVTTADPVALGFIDSLARPGVGISRG